MENPLKTDSNRLLFSSHWPAIVASFCFQNPDCHDCLFEEDQDQFQSCDVTTSGRILLSTVGDEEGISKPLKFKKATLPETNSSPLKIYLYRPLEKEIGMETTIFGGELLVLGSFLAPEKWPKPNGTWSSSLHFSGARCGGCKIWIHGWL